MINSIAKEGVFNTPYFRSRKPKKVMYEDSIVETTGFIPAKKQIERLIQAGEQLVNWRREQFDFFGDDNIDTDLEVPVRDPNFDLADASMLEKEVNVKIKAFEKAEKERKKEEKIEKEKKLKEKLEKAEKYDKLKKEEKINDSKNGGTN